jgi:PKHD-type hydroxylase
MSIYNFSPCGGLSQLHNFVTWENAFTDEELKLILAYCDKLELKDATVSGDQLEDAIRKSKVGWISHCDEIPFLYDRLAWVTRQLNAKFYDFDLSGFVEDMQYTVYDTDCSGHYDWHLDMGVENLIAPRKFSLVLQLSDPSDYEGGELQTKIGFADSTVLKQKGLISAFPSWTLHRVTPVTKGIRKTIVVWVSGPQFK